MGRRVHPGAGSQGLSLPEGATPAYRQRRVPPRLRTPSRHRWQQEQARPRNRREVDRRLHPRLAVLDEAVKGWAGWSVHLGGVSFRLTAAAYADLDGDDA